MAIELGFTVCPEFTLNSLLWGLQAAFRKLKSVTDLQPGSTRFPVSVTTFYRGLRGNSVPACFSVTGLSF
jgi:hypothetical protein